MPRYTVLPVDCDLAPVEITAHDAGAVLNLVCRLDCGEADVLHDGVYNFSVRLSSNGLWSIFQRHEAQDVPEAAPALA